jgi:hypothetical protein
MRQGKIEQSLRAGRQGVERQPDLVLAHYFLGAAYMVATESSPHGYQPAVKHLLDATVTDPRWVASWLCLGQLATMCGEYDHAQQYLLRGLELQRRGPGFGYFIGPEMVLATRHPASGSHRKGTRDLRFCRCLIRVLRSRLPRGYAGVDRLRARRPAAA